VRTTSPGYLARHAILVLSAAALACCCGAPEGETLLDDLPAGEELPVDVVNRDVNNDGVEDVL
jgi:hypothetical protein